LNNIDEEKRDPILWKTMGLVLTDGNFSNLISGLVSIYFGGLTYDTAVAVVKTLIQIAKCLIITLYGKGKTYYNVYVHSMNDSNKLKHRIASLLIKLDKSASETLSGLQMNELAALLAGIIDGDGYIGKPSSYLSISSNLDNRKGKIIHRIISHLEKTGYITINNYYHRPKYEAIFRFTNLQFMNQCIKYVYHPKRKERMKNAKNYLRNYICPFLTLELEQILCETSSAYIDHRKAPRRSKVLVLYIKPSNFEKIAYIWDSERSGYKPVPIHSKNRIMIKITEKVKRTSTGF